MSDITDLDSNYIIPFLKTIITSIENKTISDDNKKLVGEFYMKYLFHEKNTENIENKDLSDDDMLKFMFLGYYIYKHILNENTINNI